MIPNTLGESINASIPLQSISTITEFLLCFRVAAGLRATTGFLRLRNCSALKKDESLSLHPISRALCLLFAFGRFAVRAHPGLQHRVYQVEWRSRGQAGDDAFVLGHAGGHFRGRHYHDYGDRSQCRTIAAHI